MSFLDFFKSDEQKEDVISMLKADHRNVEKLFKDFELTDDAKEKQMLLDKIISELSVHSEVEEELVYPEIQKEDRKGTGEAFEEHHVVKLLLAELKKMSASSEETGFKVTVLSEAVQHHIKEEEGELLPALKVSGADLESLGQKVAERKKTLMAEMMKASKMPVKAEKQAAGTKLESTKKPAAAKQLASAKTAAEAKKLETAKKPAAKTSSNRKKPIPIQKKRAEKKAATAKKSAAPARAKTKRGSTRKAS